MTKVRREVTTERLIIEPVRLQQAEITCLTLWNTRRKRSDR